MIVPVMETGPWFNIKMSSYQYRKPIVEIRRSYNRLISPIGFPIPVRRHLYIESGPRATSTNGTRPAERLPHVAGLMWQTIGCELSRPGMRFCKEFWFNRVHNWYLIPNRHKEIYNLERTSYKGGCLLRTLPKEGKWCVNMKKTLCILYTRWIFPWI